MPCLKNMEWGAQVVCGERRCPTLRLKKMYFPETDIQWTQTESSSFRQSDALITNPSFASDAFISYFLCRFQYPCAPVDRRVYSCRKRHLLFVTPCTPFFSFHSEWDIWLLSWGTIYENAADATNHKFHYVSCVVYNCKLNFSRLKRCIQCTGRVRE